MKVQSVVLMLRCMEDEKVYRALVRLNSDGADYAGQTSNRCDLQIPLTLAQKALSLTQE